MTLIFSCSPRAIIAVHSYDSVVLLKPIIFRKTYLLKLGLKEIKDGDEKLVEDLLGMMELKMADFTATFRQLAEVTSDYCLRSLIWCIDAMCIDFRSIHA